MIHLGIYLLCIIMFIFYRHIALSKATTGTRTKKLIFFFFFNYRLYLDFMDFSTNVLCFFFLQDPVQDSILPKPDYLGKVVSVRFLHCNITVFPFYTLFLKVKVKVKSLSRV